MDKEELELYERMDEIEKEERRLLALADAQSKIPDFIDEYGNEFDFDEATNTLVPRASSKH
ncbi:TPA: hypothetical protein ACPD28_000518 [Pasteurella multocida]|nr:hypothetical protein [Pasteurella multocida]